MHDLTVAPMERVVLALALAGLRSGDRRVHPPAAEFLVRVGPRVVPELVTAATTKANPARYRVRALTTLGRIGALSATDALELLPLLHDRDLEVREAAWRVLHPAPAATG